MKQKKGISPLIATVLILGFTVALAAIIMVWGQRFTQGTMTGTERASDAQIICANEVSIAIENVCDTGSGYEVLVENNGAKDIDLLKVRFFEDASTVETKDMFSSGLVKYGIDSDTASLSLADVVKVEARPVITIGGREVTCQANVAEFGDIDGLAIGSC